MKTLLIRVNDQSLTIKRQEAEVSQTLKDFIEKNPIDEIFETLSKANITSDMIKDVFITQNPTITHENWYQYKAFNKIFQIEFLNEKIANFYENGVPFYKEKNIKKLQLFEKLCFELTDENYDDTVLKMQSEMKTKNKYKKIAFGQVLFFATIINSPRIELFLKVAKEIDGMIGLFKEFYNYEFHFKESTAFLLNHRIKLGKEFPREFDWLKEHLFGKFQDLPLILDALTKDDVNTFIDIVGKDPELAENLQNATLPMPYRKVKGNLSPMNIAAAYGSIKCFKYLINNGIQLESIATIANAVIGGNAEIVQICFRSCNEINGKIIKYAYLYHHTELADWIFEQKNTDLPHKDPQFLCLLVRSANYSQMIRFMKDGSYEMESIFFYRSIFLYGNQLLLDWLTKMYKYDYNEVVDKNKNTLGLYIAANRLINPNKYFSEINPKINNCTYENMAYVATINGNYSMLKLMGQHHIDILNTQNILKCNALYAAIASRNLNVVKFITSQPFFNAKPYYLCVHPIKFTQQCKCDDIQEYLEKFLKRF
ncbi:hypothetical protein TRFO_22544 [Tritrichomonas foetus]|uniref:DUF3447 domain-containing protein n=1 Tax=Tritrichomonas foetus TaxID=1144522 RepID=A0A1J4KGK9_9EUKA|nr:hypothetical protein TRFO_22544 [Tritrichomonas foetus]|eukprot:OHT08798.1 hypothetical protein TRFO_22544 [Tritrichomonas foetus]